MSFSIPPDTIIGLKDVSLRLDRGAHTFETANTQVIEENWLAEKAANPALFDGRVAMVSDLALEDGTLRGAFRMVRYATFLLWRRRRPISGAGHLYTHPVLVAADGALVAIRMGRHTANPRRVYFPAGAFEAEDFVDGMADPLLNMRREAMEETGLDIRGLRQEPGFHLLSKASGAVLFRRCFLESTADETARAIRAHIASQADPEIEEPVVIRGTADLPHGLAEQMPAIVKWHFEEGRMGNSE